MFPPERKGSIYKGLPLMFFHKDTGILQVSFDTCYNFTCRRVCVCGGGQGCTHARAGAI